MKYQIYILTIFFTLNVFAQNEGDDTPDVPKTSYSIKFTPDGWASFSSANAVIIPDDIEVYIGIMQKASPGEDADYYLNLHLVACPNTVINGKTTRYIPQPVSDLDKPGECINPVILRGRPGETVQLNIIEQEEPDPDAGETSSPYAKNLYKEGYDTSNGMLMATEEDPVTSDDKGDFHTYVLGYRQDTGTGFYEIRPGKEIPANKAYVAISNDDAASIDDTTTRSPRITTVIIDDPTHIISTSVDSPCNNTYTYDLCGNIVTKLQTGQVYIRGGKKFIKR